MQELPIKKLPSNPAMEGLAEIYPDIPYSTASGQAVTLSIIAPFRDRENEAEPPRRPLIVFVQGSAFTFPNIHYEIPQLSHYAQSGYVVATLTHRNCLDGHPFPAYLQDVKTAIRFLRKHADEYGIDPERVGLWGTSSGGNTALLVALTQGRPEYITEEHAGYSDAVRCVVDCFGPKDMLQLYGMVKAAQDPGLTDIFNALMGGEENQTILKAMSPLYQIESGQAYPPFLLLHGNADMLVPYEQSVSMFKALLNAGAKAEMICVENGPHEGSFWSKEVHAAIAAFMQQHV